MSNNTVKFKAGDHVWFEQTWAGPTSGTIIEIVHTKDRRTNEPETWARIHADNGGDTGAKIDKIWATKDACLAALKAAEEATVSKYKASIKDVKDLIQFMYDNNVATAEEYTDWEARRAARERAKELLGINLDD